MSDSVLPRNVSYISTSGRRGSFVCLRRRGPPGKMAVTLRERVLGSLLGLAVADAVGTTVEAMPPGSFEEVTDMQGGGKFSLQPGQVRE